MRIGLALAIGVSFAACALAQQAAPPENTPANTIRATGCVRPGVENGCTTLKDKKTGDVYTLFFADEKTPASNTGISFEATPHQGMTTCMQGKAVNVTKWSKVKMRCSASKPEGSSSY
jgi:hypothetical protein